LGGEKIQGGPGKFKAGRVRLGFEPAERRGWISKFLKALIFYPLIVPKTGVWHSMTLAFRL